MKRIVKVGLFACAMGAIMFSCQDESEMPGPNAAPGSDSFQPINGQYIIVLDEQKHSGARAVSGTYEEAQLMMTEISKQFLAEKQIDTEIKAVFSNTIRGFVANIDDDQLPLLENDDRIKYIEQDQMIILAPPPGKGPGNGGGDDGGGSAAQETPYGITRVNGVSSYNGTGVAWVLDTGIDLDHEDLNVDASRGFNAFTTGRDSKSLDDGHGHGTHVAGTIAAINNSVGVIGVAPGATVIPVKVLDSRGSGSYSGVIAGIDYVGANGSNGDVANMSLGGGASQAVDDAVIAASSNVKFALAAGNESRHANNSSPARANGPNIYTISAMNSSDNWASFSNYGNPPVDYCAPGVAILSTWKGGGYNSISGTSMASPHAAGVLLLGNPRSDGNVNGDPDGNADPIIVH